MEDYLNLTEDQKAHFKTNIESLYNTQDMENIG